MKDNFLFRYNNESLESEMLKINKNVLVLFFRGGIGGGERLWWRKIRKTAGKVSIKKSGKTILLLGEMKLSAAKRNAFFVFPLEVIQLDGI